MSFLRFRKRPAQDVAFILAKTVSPINITSTVDIRNEILAKASTLQIDQSALIISPANYSIDYTTSSYRVNAIMYPLKFNE